MSAWVLGMEYIGVLSGVCIVMECLVRKRLEVEEV